MARTNDFKTCGAGRERELGFGLQEKKKKRSSAPTLGKIYTRRPSGPGLRQTDNYLEDDILWKQKTHRETPEFPVAASSNYSQGFWTH